MGVRGTASNAIENPHITFDSLKLKLYLSTLMGVGSSTPSGYKKVQMLKSPIKNGVDQCIQ